MRKISFVKLSLLVLCIVLGGGFAQAQTINLQLQNDYTLGTGSPIPRFAVGDLNRDGKPDIVTATGTVSTPVNILLNNGAGSFGAPSAFGATLNASVVAIGGF
ncbi:MAG: VCBS repeat-containing protein [Acidobacteriota bacterium]|nr:VCBS repeat-containing protein [Acidobacteriota bacterium]